VLLLAGQIAKPPEWAAVVLIFGVGLALVAAVMFMAAVFERNVAAGRSQNFNYWALGMASISALLVVIGTVETLHIKNTPVEVTTVVSLVLVLVALRIAFRAPRVPPGTVVCDKASCQCPPENEPIHGTHAGEDTETVHEMLKAVPERGKDEQRDGESPEQDAVIDGEPAQAPSKVSKG
jgi:hypothetical protein